MKGFYSDSWILFLRPPFMSITIPPFVKSCKGIFGLEKIVRGPPYILPTTNPPALTLESWNPLFLRFKPDKEIKRFEILETASGFIGLISSIGFHCWLITDDWSLITVLLLWLVKLVQLFLLVQLVLYSVSCILYSAFCLLSSVFCLLSSVSCLFF